MGDTKVKDVVACRKSVLSMDSERLVSLAWRRVVDPIFGPRQEKDVLWGAVVDWISKSVHCGRLVTPLTVVSGSTLDLEPDANAEEEEEVSPAWRAGAVTIDAGTGRHAPQPTNS